LGLAWPGGDPDDPRGVGAEEGGGSLVEVLVVEVLLLGALVDDAGAVVLRVLEVPDDVESAGCGVSTTGLGVIMLGSALAVGERVSMLGVNGMRLVSGSPLADPVAISTRTTVGWGSRTAPTPNRAKATPPTSAATTTTLASTCSLARRVNEGNDQRRSARRGAGVRSLP
jgi:hypothetical protein